MSEVDFDLLLDAVNTAIALPEEDFVAQTLRPSAAAARRQRQPRAGLAADPVSRRLVRRLLRPVPAASHIIRLSH